MNPSVGSGVTGFDRDAAVIAFQRAPGNRSPDSDLTDSGSAPRAGTFGGSRTLWSPPVFLIRT